MGPQDLQPEQHNMASMGVAGSMKITPRTDGTIEATAPEAERKLSMDVGHVGYVERKYGLEARMTRGVTFEEYRHWAKVERQMEVSALKLPVSSNLANLLQRDENQLYNSERGPTTMKSVLKGRFSKGVHHENAKKANRALNEKTDRTSEQSSDVVAHPNAGVTDAEWRTAARALRTASWGTIFFVSHVLSVLLRGTRLTVT